MKGYNGIYLMAGYPDREAFAGAAAEALKRFDFLEIGIPFSDPVADGPVIADAAVEVLSRGFRFTDLLESVREVRDAADPGKKIYFMTYANIVHCRGIGEFALLCRDHGIAGVILPDVPFSESRPFGEAFRREGLEFIHFISPENTPGQIREIARAANGFLYFVSVRGVTGGALSLDDETKEKIALARKASPVPVVLGFGIRDSGSAREALRHADGFIMGTRIIELMRDDGRNGLERFFNELEAALV